MISHLLDTNAVISLIGRKSARLVDRVLESQPQSIGLSSVVVHELYFGAYKSAKIEHNLETLRLLLADFPIIDFDRNDALAAGRIRAALAMKGTPIGPFDALIAGQASARTLTLVTNKVGKFKRVDGLRLQDWTL